MTFALFIGIKMYFNDMENKFYSHRVFIYFILKGFHIRCYTKLRV